MNIAGITTCVSEEYAGYLSNSLNIWLRTLDSLTIVTKPGDVATKFSKDTTVIETDVFGEYFNKGSALNVAFKAANPTDWVLSFDCDIVPPINWKDTVEMGAKKGHLNGAQRFQDRRLIDSSKSWPKGYFQLWHVSDTCYNRDKPFIEWCRHAGRYDYVFWENWRTNCHNLDLKLVHQGNTGKNWWGEGTTPEQIQQAFNQAGIDFHGPDGPK